MILNFGSLNIDHVYRVDRFVAPGETRAADSYTRFAGGKGFNQSIALARAGAKVAHAGRIGPDGRWLVERLAAEGVDVSLVEEGPEPTGHASIQVDATGENAILISGGANRGVGAEQIERVVATLGPGDELLLQNEISGVARLLEAAGQAGVTVTLNPSPIGGLETLPLDTVGRFVLNRGEGEALSGETDPDAILDALRDRYPQAAIVLTLGGHGARYADSLRRIEVPAERARPLDTTGAGDTFTGYLLAGLVGGAAPEHALRWACRAAARCIERAGAADSIPRESELEPLD